MAIEGLAIKQPAVTVVEIDDPTLAGEGVDLIDLDAVQLQSMSLRVRRVIVRLEACTVVNYSTNAPVRTRTTVLEGLIAFVTFGPRAQGTVNGLAVFPGLMLAVEPATEGTFVVEAGYESIAFLVRAQDIQEAPRRPRARGRLPSTPRRGGAAGERRDGSRPPRLGQAAGGRRCTGTPHLRRGTAGANRGAGRVARDAAGDAGHSQRFRAHAQRPDPTGAQSTSSGSPRTTHCRGCDERVHVTDLCAATGVSERALQYAFKEVMGLTPVHYLMRLRLHRVRQALLAATHASSTVSAEALKWGFWHFGEFSRAYKDVFRGIAVGHATTGAGQDAAVGRCNAPVGTDQDRLRLPDRPDRKSRRWRCSPCPRA